ncbi:hypothetical protein E2C01_064054 [Portunus trituberculatus]|uniref:Uncharacterized protein n=1 Tax=Portunus trituberculatus TaxID=210409 RepID=A0A5B7HI29_PORTR|nr:hypothetical protein [Portunus trituberculatus]
MFLWRLRCAASWRGATLTLLLLSIANCFFSYYTYLNSRLPFDSTETYVGIKIVKTLATNFLTSKDPS